MGSCVSSVEPFSEFGQRDEDGKPQRRRQCTDIFFLYFFGAFLVVVSALLIYCASIGDVNRILRGYDDCGNVCGQTNKRMGSDLGCVGLDMTAKPYLLVRSSKECVSNCAQYGYDTVFDRCVPRRDHDEPGDITKRRPMWQDVIDDINACSNEIVYMSIISCALVTLAVMLLRYNTEPFIWGILISGSVAFVALSIGLWIGKAMATEVWLQQVLMIYAIVASVFTAVLLLCLGVMFKRIKLVVGLFREASKAIGAVPHLLLQPIATILAFLVCFVLYIYGTILTLSAGKLTKITEDNYEYMPNNAVVLTYVLFVVAVVWMMYFIIGCQNMIVGGTISAWYFIRDKALLSSPILYATHNLVRYHLGTVAFGSFIMMLLEIVRYLIECLKRAMRENGCGIFLLCCSCIFQMFDEFMRYFTRLAFLITSMHGVPFCKGGKTAMRLIVNNCMSTIALNSAGGFILFFINLVILVATLLIGYLMMDKTGLHLVWYPLAVSGIISWCMSHYVFSVYNVTLETIFLCFCEDSEVNDGLSRPYYMSADLMLFVENSKKALEQLEASKTPKAANNANNGRGDAWNSNNATAAPV